MPPWQSIDVRPDSFLGKGAVLVPPSPTTERGISLAPTSSLVTMTATPSRMVVEMRFGDGWRRVTV